MKRALIVFTREPEAGKTKTRMMPYLNGEECAELHESMLRDIAREVVKVKADLWLCHTSTTGECPIIRRIFEHADGFFPQEGENLGVRMFNAMDKLLAEGYESVALMGTDIPEIKAESIEKAFELAESSDVALGPTADGGYHLVAMKKAAREPFEMKEYGHSTVLENTIASIKDAGLTVGVGDTYQDMDEPCDLAGLRKRLRTDRNALRTATGRFVMEHAKVSIIVPIYNEASTIAGLQKQMAPYKAEAEIIFVDGGSTDATCKMIEHGYKLISSCKGRARQMNEGAKASTGDVLFFLHADSILPDGFIEEIKRVMATHEYGCFGVKFPSKNILMLSNRIISNDRAFRRGLPFSDQGIFMSRELFEYLGGFPEFPIMEDYQLGLTLRKQGYKPGRTKSRITTSIRRYGKGTIGIAKTEYQMWNQRRRYRRGEDVERLAAEYRDVR